MSFVFAEKMEATFRIYCDTKIGFNSFAGACYSQEQMALIKKYGIVKTTIICPEMSISYAGNNIFLASKLFSYLYKLKRFEINVVLDIALAIHLEAAPDDIEFIIASCENQRFSLNCIKNGKLDEDCNFCWIGSKQAFSRFQQFRNERNENDASDRTDMAFLDVVSGCKDGTVGGFRVAAEYDNSLKQIRYSHNITFQNSKSQLVKPGEAVIWYLSAADGGFSCEQIPISCEELMLDIKQMEPNILYTRNKRCTREDLTNPQLFGLMLPMLFRRGDGI